MGANILGSNLDLIDPKSSQEAIIKACVKGWFAKGPNGLSNCCDCNGFVKSVQRELSLRPFLGNANGIFAEVDTRADWQVLGIGTHATETAGNAANEGFLTIAIWRNPDPAKNGHVAIITSYFSFVGIEPEQHAIGAWGQLGAVGSLMDRISKSFRSGKYGGIKYAKCIMRPYF